MARIRTIKPELHSSASLAGCSIGARWVFVGLFTLADDEGRIRDLPKMIVGALFPLDEDVTVTMVVGWLNELEAIGCICRYSVDGSDFFHLPGWSTHQRISKPTASRIPEPPGDSQENPGNPAGSTERPRESSVEVEVEVEREVESDANNPDAFIHSLGGEESIADAVTDLEARRTAVAS